MRFGALVNGTVLDHASHHEKCLFSMSANMGICCPLNSSFNNLACHSLDVSLKSLRTCKPSPNKLEYNSLKNLLVVSS